MSNMLGISRCKGREDPRWWDSLVLDILPGSCESVLERFMVCCAQATLPQSSP